MKKFFYFDMETTGLDFNNAEIATIQFHQLNEYNGKPIGKLQILKSWELGEKGMLEQFKPNLFGGIWDFVFVGKNLSFDFALLNRRLQHHGLYKDEDKYKVNLEWMHNRVIIDLKPIMVLMNNGKFVGFSKIIPSRSDLTNAQIPGLIEDKQYDRVIRYIEDEATEFIAFYEWLHRPDAIGWFTKCWEGDCESRGYGIPPSA